jgi:Cytochrome oxidase complex assembly protein 1
VTTRYLVRSSHESWIARHPGRALTTALAGVALLLAVFWGTIFFVVVGALRNSVPARMAINKAAANPAVVETLGRPLRERWLVTGRLHTRTAKNRAPAHAQLKIPVTGPLGKGKIETTAEKRSGQWVLTECTITFAGNDEDAVDLLDRTEPGQSISQAPAQ